MTDIVVFCDGTWNSPSMDETTSIYKLSQMVENDPANGQVVGYFPGIGTPDVRFNSELQNFLLRYGGGAFGWGLDGKVKEAYQFIARVYHPGARIFLFGFSRGAYTARSVAGMIRKCGIVSDAMPETINAAFTLYRKSGVLNKPDKRHIMEERRALSPRYATSQADLDWRDDGSELVHIAYLGVLDTVGARGIPVAFLGPIAALWNSQYKFHDGQLSSLVRSARHAIAADERRVLYPSARWDNLDTLNRGDTGPDRPYQQMWFIGNHGMVGGSAEPQSLAVLPQHWILDGSGLKLKPGAGPDLSRADPLAKSIHLPDTGLLRRWRPGPKAGDAVHISVMKRVQGRADYRPQSLKASVKAWLRS